jgi:hypothetical protein
MMRKYHVRFGGGRLEKEPQGHLVSRLPNNTEREEGHGHGVSVALLSTVQARGA